MGLRLLLQRDTSALAAFYADVEEVGGGPGDAPRWCSVSCGDGTAVVDLDAMTVKIRDRGGRECKVQDVPADAAGLISTCLSRYTKLEDRLRRPRAGAPMANVRPPSTFA